MSPGDMQDAMLIPTPPAALETLTPSVSLNQQHIQAPETRQTVWLTGKAPGGSKFQCRNPLDQTAFSTPLRCGLPPHKLTGHNFRYLSHIEGWTPDQI